MNERKGMNVELSELGDTASAPEVGTVVGQAFELVWTIAAMLDEETIHPDMVRWAVQLLRTCCDRLDELPTRWGELAPIEIAPMGPSFRQYCDHVEYLLSECD